MYRIFCVFLLIAHAALQAEANFIDCASKGSEVGNYTTVTVTDCGKGQRECPLKRGHNATITIDFNVFTVAKEVKSEVHGVVAGVPIPFPISQPDGCKDSGLACPLEKDKGPFTYSNTLFVQPIYPKMSVKVRWELKDENGNDIVCVEIPARIQ